MESSNEKRANMLEKTTETQLHVELQANLRPPSKTNLEIIEQYGKTSLTFNTTADNQSENQSYEEKTKTETPMDTVTNKASAPFINSQEEISDQSPNDLEHAPSATTSRSANLSINAKSKSSQVLRTLRPKLHRKSKSRAYRKLQMIAKGIVLKESYRRTMAKKKKMPKRRFSREVPMRVKPMIKVPICRSYVSCSTCDSSMS